MIDESEMIELRMLELLESEARWWTIEEIASLLDLSKATIQKYLGYLKTRIETFPKEQIMIETSTSKGIYLHRLASFNVQLLYTQILKEFLVFSIFSSFLYSEYVSIVKVSSENFISAASLRRKYKVYNAYFESLDMVIKKDVFSGDERQIRWFFSEFYWQIFRGTEWPFRLIPQSFMNDVIHTIQNFFDLKLIPEVKEEMGYWVTIHSLRHMKGYRVPEDEEIKKYNLNNPLYGPFIEILKDIFPNEAKNRDEKGPGEMQYLFYLICALPVMERSAEYSQLIYQSHLKGNTVMYQMTCQWLELYQEIFGKITSRETYYKVDNQILRIHSFSYLYHMGEPLFFKKNYVEEIIAYHPRFFEKMYLILDTLKEEFPSITKNRAYLIENYALLAMESLAINQFEKTVRIALSFSKGVLYEAVVREKLLSYFSGKYKLEFVDHIEPKEILITDLPHVLGGINCALVSAQTQLTARDYENIEQMILDYI